MAERDRRTLREGPSNAEVVAQADQTLSSSTKPLQRGWCCLDKTWETAVSGWGPGSARGTAGTHHLLQLVLDLPVDFCHLEEHVSCKDRTG